MAQADWTVELQKSTVAVFNLASAISALFSIANIDFQFKYRSLIDCNGHRKGSDWMFNVHLDSAGMGSFQFTSI